MLYYRCRLIVTIFLLVVTSLVSRVCASVTTPDVTPTHQQKVYEEHTVQVLKRIETSSTFGALYDTIEQTPAIKQSIEKSIRIMLADAEDAVLAAHAVQQFATIATSHGEVTNTSTERNTLQGIQDGDRRFQQLSECIELCVTAMRIADLARYTWGLTVLDIRDDERFARVIQEYARRVDQHKDEEKNNKLSMVEIATMIWTVGCVKDIGSPSNVTFVKEAAICLSHDLCRNENSTLPIRLSIRMLWSLAAHGVFVQPLSDRCLMSCIKEPAILSPTNAVTLLWCLAEFRYLNVPIAVGLIDRIVAHVNTTDYREGTAQTTDAGKKFELLQSQLFDSLRSISDMAKERVVDGEAFYAPTSDTSTTTSASSYLLVERIQALISLLLPRAMTQIPTSSVSLASSVLRSVAAINIEVIPMSTQEGVLKACFDRAAAALSSEAVRPASIAKVSNLLKAMTTIPDYPQFLQRETPLTAPAPAAVLGSTNDSTQQKQQQQLQLQQEQQRPAEADSTPVTATTGTVPTEDNAAGTTDTTTSSSSSTPAVQVPHRRVRRLLIWERIMRDARWHRLAGRLAVKCTFPGPGGVQDDEDDNNNNNNNNNNNDYDAVAATDAEALDRADLAASCWSLALLGHSYRPLLHRTRQAFTAATTSTTTTGTTTKDSLHDELNQLTPIGAGRLLVAVAAAEAVASALPNDGNKKGAATKLDNAFIEMVVHVALRKLHLLPSVRETVQTMIALARLGHIVSLEDTYAKIEMERQHLFEQQRAFTASIYATAAETVLEPAGPPADADATGIAIANVTKALNGSLNSDAISSTNNDDVLGDSVVGDQQHAKECRIHISPRKLAYISTKKLIKLHWAIGHLPARLIAPNTLSIVQCEISKRDLSPRISSGGKDSDQLLQQLQQLEGDVDSFRGMYVDYVNRQDMLLLVESLASNAKLSSVPADALYTLESHALSTTARAEDGLHVGGTESTTTPTTAAAPAALDGVPSSPIEYLSIDSVCNTLLAHCQKSSTPNLEATIIRAASAAAAEATRTHLMRPTLLVETLLAFMDLDWYNPSIVDLCERCLGDPSSSASASLDRVSESMSMSMGMHGSSINRSGGSDASTGQDSDEDEDSAPNVGSAGDGAAHANVEATFQFHCGVLSELLRIYKEKFNSQKKKEEEGGFGLQNFGRRLLSRFFPPSSE